MFRTVLSRLMVIFLAVVMVAMGVQGIMLYNVYKNDTILRTQQYLMEEAHGIAELMGRFLTTQQGKIELYTYLSVTTRKSQSRVWFVNADGTINLEALPGNQGVQEVASLGMLSEDEKERYLAPVLAGKEFSMVGNFRGRFADDTITVACPVFYGRSVIAGAVFVHCQVNELDGTYSNAWKIILLASAIAATLAMILIFMTARSITRPLAEMNLAARDIAKGRFNRKLERTGPDELGQLAESFNIMADELKKQEQTRISFVANVSHELKSPMTSIQGFAQGMVDGTIKPEEHEKYLSIILDETRRLNKLIRELLDLSQFENGNFSLNMTSFDLNELIRRVVIRYLDRMEAQGIEPEIEFRQDYCYVLGDSDRIEQVLVNLLDNAIKFTPEGGQIRIWTHNSQDKVLVSISDSGSGISEADLPFIFDRFYKVDKAHTDKKGTGLGLAIVKSILEQHGETIQVNSKLGAGTTFAFTLKRAEKPAREEAKKISSKNEQAQ